MIKQVYGDCGATRKNLAILVSELIKKLKFHPSDHESDCKKHKALLDEIEGFISKVQTWTAANCSEQCSALVSNVQELEALGSKTTEYLNQLVAQIAR